MLVALVGETDVALARADAHAICGAEVGVGVMRLRAQGGAVAVAGLRATVLGLPLVTLVELLCFDMAHLLLGRVVVEGVLALLVARQHSIVAELDARAICGTTCTCTSRPLRQVASVSVRIRRLWAVFFLLIRRQGVVMA